MILRFRYNWLPIKRYQPFDSIKASFLGMNYETNRYRADTRPASLDKWNLINLIPIEFCLSIAKFSWRACPSFCFVRWLGKKKSTGYHIHPPWSRAQGELQFKKNASLARPVSILVKTRWQGIRGEFDDPPLNGGSPLRKIELIAGRFDIQLIADLLSNDSTAFSTCSCATNRFSAFYTDRVNSTHWCIN